MELNYLKGRAIGFFVLANYHERIPEIHRGAWKDCDEILLSIEQTVVANCRIAALALVVTFDPNLQSKLSIQKVRQRGDSRVNLIETTHQPG